MKTSVGHLKKVKELISYAGDTLRKQNILSLEEGKTIAFYEGFWGKEDSKLFMI